MSHIIKKENHPLITIEIDKISTQPGKYCMSYNFDNLELVKSIKDIGLVNKPYIVKDNERYQPVTGYRRITALKSLNIKDIECFDLTASGMTCSELLSFAIYDNIFTRSFNLIEKSMVLNRLHLFIKDVNEVNTLLRKLNINPRELKQLQALENLNEQEKELIASDLLSMKALNELNDIRDTDDFTIYVDYINKLKLNYNQQIQFIDYIFDLTRINNTNISLLLKNSPYINIFEDENLNTPQKAKKIIDLLREQRNPDFTKLQNAFENKINKLKLPSNIRIKHPRFFEAEGYQLEVNFKNGTELKDDLKSLIEKDGLDEVCDPWSNKKP